MRLGWLARLGVGTSESFQVPEGTRVYAVGDIHGRLDLLRNLVEQIQGDVCDATVSRRVVVFVGDYVDRGLDSRQVIDYLLGNPLPGLECVYLKGNHESWMLEFLEDHSVGHAWLPAGGQATLLSYGVGLDEGESASARLENARRALVQRLPDTHRAFLERLELTHKQGDYLFVHAGIRPRVPLERQTADDLLWIRREFTDNRSNHGFIVVHGHTVRPRPEVRRNRIGIDTGAFATGRLTCLVLEASEHRFLVT